MRSVLALAAGVLAGIAPVWAGTPASRPAERLLLGFEPDEVKHVDQLLTAAGDPKTTHVKTAKVDGASATQVELFGTQGVWNLFDGSASQGRFALGIGRSRSASEKPFEYFQPGVPVPPEPAEYYRLFHDQYASSGGATFNTCGVFRALFPTDWSGYEVLRVDAFAEESVQTVEVVLEDEEVGPPVLRKFRVEPGKWVTLELDLRQAMKERGLDLSRMATLSMGVVAIDKAPANKTFTCLVDNLRLAQAAAPMALPVVRDATPMTLPDYYRAISKPHAETLPAVKPDRSALKTESPIVIPIADACGVCPAGWAAAFDNRHLLVGFTNWAKRQVMTLESADGGKTWRGLDGTEKPTVLPTTGYSDHQSGRGDVVGQRGDVVFLASNCNSGGVAGFRLWGYHLTFDGSGWKKTMGLVDCDARHCVSRNSVVRAPDGRLWAGYGLASRLGTICMNVRYSDDEGVVWKASREGTSGLIPGSLFPPVPPAVIATGFSYTFEEPRLVPFGAGVACLVQTRKRERADEFGPLQWQRLENGRWTPPETIEEPKWTSYYGHTMPIIKAVSVNGSEIFAVSAFFDGVLHYKGGRWTREAADVPASSMLCVAGEKTVVAVGAVCPGGDMTKGPVTLRLWQRRTDGTWAAPRDVVKEQDPLAVSEDGLNLAGFIVPAVAPPNFVPLAWVTKGGRAIKFLRVPVLPED